MILLKISRIRSGDPPRVLDLFAGCGGALLGFHAAGFRIAGAVEVDPVVAATHARNLFRDHHRGVMELHARPMDITLVDPHVLVRELGLGSVDMAVDIIINPENWGSGPNGPRSPGTRCRKEDP